MAFLIAVKGYSSNPISSFITRQPSKPLKSIEFTTAQLILAIQPPYRKYNIFSDKVSDKEIGECCIHYCDRKKPWMVYSGKIDDQYWNYFSLIPWADNPKELVEYVRLAPDLNYINRIKLEPFRKQVKTIFCLLEIVVKNMYNEFKKFKKYL